MMIIIAEAALHRPYKGAAVIFHRIYDLPKEGDLTRSHRLYWHCQVTLSLLLLARFTWEATLYVGDSAEFGVRKLKLNTE